MNESAAATTLQVHDVDELNDAVTGAALELVQLGPGSLRASVTHYWHGQLSIDEGSVSCPLRIRGRLDPQRYSIGLFHTGSQGTFNGHRVDSSRLLFFPPGRELNGYVREKFGWISLIVPVDWAEQLPPAASSYLHTDCREVRPEVSKLARLRTAIDVISSPAVLRGASPVRSNWLIADLRNTLGEALSDVDSSSYMQGSHSMGHFCTARRAERYMRERMGEPLCIDDLCMTLRVSRRYLEYAFNDAFGTSPSRYLRLLRLHEVRRRLRRPSESTTVTREALRLGFNHLSLFSLQYKKAFGESPSVTLSGTARQQRHPWTSDVPVLPGMRPDVAPARRADSG